MFSSRNEEKTILALLWITEFKYSTKKIICDLLGVSYQGQQTFFNKINSEGLTTYIKHPYISSNLIMLTPKGRGYAAQFSKKAISYNCSKTRNLNSMVFHDLATQELALTVVNKKIPYNFSFDHYISNIEKNKRPDLIVDNEQVLTAYEIELTQKSSLRVYLAFLNHFDAMNNNVYHYVKYIFLNRDLCVIYTKLFNEVYWKHCYRNSNNKVSVLKEASGQTKYLKVSLDSELRNRFSFDFFEVK